MFVSPWSVKWAGTTRHFLKTARHDYVHGPAWNGTKLDWHEVKWTLLTRNDPFDMYSFTESTQCWCQTKRNANSKNHHDQKQKSLLVVKSSFKGKKESRKAIKQIWAWLKRENIMWKRAQEYNLINSIFASHYVHIYLSIHVRTHVLQITPCYMYTFINVYFQKQFCDAQRFTCADRAVGPT